MGQRLDRSAGKGVRCQEKSRLKAAFAGVLKMIGGLIAKSQSIAESHSLDGGEIWIGLHAMLTNVEPIMFLLFADPNPVKEDTDHRPENPGSQDRKKGESENPHNLESKLGEAMAGKQAFIGIEQPNGEGSPHAAGAVDGKGANRIINF